MIRTWLAVASFALAIAVPAVAHEGHIHPVLGTVSAIHGKQIDVTTRDGKSVTVTVDDSTKIVRGTSTGAIADVKPGMRVSIMPRDEKPPIVAKEIRLGAAKPAGPPSSN